MGAIDLAQNRGKSGAAAAHPGQLVGPGILAVPCGLCAIFRCDLAVAAALGAVVRGNLAVVDGTHAAVGGLGALRSRPGTCVLVTGTIARRAISRGSVEVTGRVVARLGLLVTQPGGDVTVPCGQPGLATAQRRQLVGPGILAVLGRLGTILGRNFAVVDRPDAAVGSVCAPRVGPGTFVRRALAVARRGIACAPVAISGGVVTSLGLPVAQTGRDVTVPRGEASLAPAYGRHLVYPGILAVLRRLGAIVCGNPAVVDGSFAAVRGAGATQIGSGTLIRRAPAIARRSVRRGSVELTGGVVTRFGVTVALFRRQVARPSSEPGSFAILCGLRAIVGCQFSVVDGLGSIVSGLSPTRGGLSALVRRAPAVAGRAIPRGSVKITGRVVTGFRLSVTQAGRHVTVLRSKTGLTTACACQLVRARIVTVLGGLGTIFGRYLAVVDGLGAVVCSPGPPRSGLITFVRRVLTVGGRPIAGGSIEIARSVISRFGLSIAQPCRHVTVLRGEPGLPTAYSGQLVGPRVLAVLGGLGAIFGRNLAVVDGLGTVIRSVGAL